MNQLTRLFFASVSLPITGLAFADFAGMYVDTSESVVLDGVSYKSHRVYALFTDPNDRTFSVAGLAGSGAGPSLEFEAQGGGLFRQCVVPCDVLSCSTAAQPVADLQGGYHSYVCIRSGNHPSDFPPFGTAIEASNDQVDPPDPGVFPEFPNNISFSPDVLCLASPTEVGIQGNFWSTGGIDGGYLPVDPVNGKSTGQIILIAQFTLPESSEFTFQGNLFYNYTPEGFPKGTAIPGQAPFFVSSSDFSGLSECSSFDNFFTAFSQAVDEDPYREWDLCDDGIFDFCQGTESTDIGSNDPVSDCDADGVNDLCQFEISFIDLNDNLVKDTCECIADLDGDGVVNLSDIVTLLFAWGDTSPGELDVDATGKSKGIIDDADLNTVLRAAVPPETVAEDSPLRPFLSGCGLLPTPSPLPAVVPDDVVTEQQSALTREGVSDGLFSNDSVLSFVVPNAPDADVSFPDRQPEDKGVIAHLRNAEQDEELAITSELAAKNNDALTKLFEILPPPPPTQASQSVVSWDLDRDGLLDPWSVMVLPLSSWPEELKPFAELLRP